MLRRFAPILILAFIFLGGSRCLAGEGIVLNEKEYFSGPGFSFLLFHNNYQVGYQGGLQMIMNDERVLISATCSLIERSAKPAAELQVLRRKLTAPRELPPSLDEFKDGTPAIN